MLNSLIFVGAVAYGLAAIAAFVLLRRRPALSLRIWTADIVVSVVLVALAIADRDWFLTPLWVLNTALAVWNLRLARTRRDMDESWANPFRN